MREAIILLNMGGPNNLDEVELFLYNMFTDKNIITTKSAPLRRFIATMITFFRTESAQEVYIKLGGKSPIVELTQKLVAALGERLDGVYIDFAMRYTPPFSDEVIERLIEKRIEKIYLIPLYPQYSSTTTKSSLEDFEVKLHDSRCDAILTELQNFYKNERYNEAILERIEAAMAGAAYEEFELIFSAHGLPQKIVDSGDPYEMQIEEHTALLQKMLQARNIDFADVHLAYQSKVGPMRWLEPSLETRLGKVRTKKVLIYPIAFIVDNSETLFELDIEYREIAEEKGITEYRVARCVSTSERFVDALVELYEKMRS